MKKPILHFYHHLGMGDHILCNGMVRYFTKDYIVALFVKTKNKENVLKMFKDEKDIMLIPVNWDADVNTYLALGGMPLFKKATNDDKYPFDIEMYKSIGLDISVKWNNAYYDRDLEREKEVYYDIYKLKDGEEYTFAHSGCEVRYPISGKVVYPERMDVDLFDHWMVMERAKELHLANSSFMCLSDTFAINPNVSYYPYIRSHPVHLPPEETFTLNPTINYKFIY